LRKKVGVFFREKWKINFPKLGEFVW
jgi:hypothetical protein